MVDVSTAVGQIVNAKAFGTALYWIGYSLLGIILCAVMFIIYHFLSFGYTVTVFPIYGSARDGIFSVQKPVKNRVKWIKNQTAWRKLWPIFNRKNIEPFDAEYIYPGKRIYAFELNNEWIPGRINVRQSENQLRAEINPVPYFVRNWQGLQYRENATEYAQANWWDQNKAFVMTLVTVGVCCVLCLLTVYFTYKYLAPGRADWAMLTSAIKQAGTVPSIGPT